MKVLIAEDKQTWHRLLEIVLSLRGIEVIHAYTPREALNKAVSEKPDVAILDVSLSGGTAYDAIRGISEVGVPVIVIGHKAEGLDPEKAKSLGAFEVLEKPFTVEELLEVLRKLKKEKPTFEEKEAIILPSHGEVEEITPGEEVEVIELEESPEEIEAIELTPVEEAQQEPGIVEEVVKPVSEEISTSHQVNIPPEKVEEIVREVAWEVIPEIAEKVIREEIEKLIKSRLA